MAFTVKEFFKRFPDDQACLEAIMQARLGTDGRMDCPSCQRAAHWYKIEGVNKETGEVRPRKAYACQWCGHHYYPCVGTPFEDSRTALVSWFYAMFLFTSSRHGVPAKELQRQLGVTYKTAWRMGHQIRKLMATEEPASIGGHVEIDDTLVGGVSHGVGTGHGRENKAIVLGAVERGGKIIGRVIPAATKENIGKLVREKVRPRSTVSTDEALAMHAVFRGTNYRHGYVNHSAKEWVKGQHHTQSIENLWSRLKLSIKGTHISVSKKHLGKYVAEFTYRFNERGRSDEMFDDLCAAASQPRKLSELGR